MPPAAAMPLPSQAPSNSGDPLYPELWHAGAGPLITVPRVGVLVFYFPQGHIEQEHEATDQERRERKIKNSHPDQGKVRMLTREEWEEVQEVRPRTPFESKLARPHARIRTGEPVRLEDVKDWATE